MVGLMRGTGRWMACMLCAFALLLSGVVHHPPAVAASSVDLSDYVLPDGSFPDLCLTGDHLADGAAGSDAPGGHRDRHDCGPCCLSVVAGVPSPAIVYLLNRFIPPSAIARPDRSVPRQPLRLAAGGARAPPAL